MSDKSEYVRPKAFPYVMKDGRRFRPLADRLIVKAEAVPDKIGSIILPDTVKWRMKHEMIDLRRGVVVAMGDGMPTVTGDRWPMPDVEAGDTVIYLSGAAVRFELDGEELFSVRDDVVFAEDMKREAAAE